MNCESCKHWKLMPVDGFRGDSGLERMGYRNCDKSTDRYKYAKFLHKNTKACDKWTCTKNSKS